MHQVGYLPVISAGCTDNKTLNFVPFECFMRNRSTESTVNFSNASVKRLSTQK
jgi:hypothetical protein